MLYKKNVLMTNFYNVNDFYFHTKKTLNDNKNIVKNFSTEEEWSSFSETSYEIGVFEDYLSMREEVEVLEDEEFIKDSDFYIKKLKESLRLKQKDIFLKYHNHKEIIDINKKMI